MNAKYTIAEVLQSHSKEIYRYMNSNSQLPQCFEVIKKILLETEVDNIDITEARRCIRTLQSALRNPHLFLSVYSTWCDRIKVVK